MSTSKNGNQQVTPSGGASLRITTDRLVLRAPCADDLDDMFAVYSDPVAMRYWSTAPHEDKAVTSELLARRLTAWATAPVNFQVTLDGRYIGNAGNFHRNEIGFMLSPTHWRKGLISEAMKAIIPHLWQATKHKNLFADADPNNDASVGLLKSLGFTETHRAHDTFCIGGVWSDSVYLTLPRPNTFG